MRGAAKRPRQLNPHNRQDSSPTRRCHHLFPVDSLVEVQTDEEDFKGVFFIATVIPSSPLSKKKYSKNNFKKLFVEYHNLLAHENGSECLREHVDASFVRPAPPPQEDVQGFQINDSVDAFYKDGWWTGVVTRVLEGGKFIVTFQYPPDELEFGLSDLRVHWDWCNGSWVRPEKQSIAALMFEVGRKVEVSFDLEDFQDAWFPATIKEVLGNGASFVMYCSSKNGNETELLEVTVDSHHVRPCPPLLKDKNFILLEKVDSFFNFGWWNGVITKLLEDCRYVVFFKQMKTEKEFHQSELRPHMEWKDGKWFTTSSSQLRKPRKVGGKSRTPTLQLGNPELDVEGKEPDPAENAAKDVQNDHAEKETEIPIIIGLPCTEIGSTEFEKSRRKRGRRSISKEIMKLVTDQKPQSNDLAIENIKNSKQSETGEFSQTKKRGRPRKVLINAPHSLVTGTQNGNVASEEFSRKDGDLHGTLELVVTGMDGSLPNPELAFNGCNDESDPKNRIGRLKKRTSANIEEVAKESISLRKNPSSRRGRRRTIDSLDASRGTTMEFKCAVDTVKKIVTEAPCIEFENEPLSKWIEGIQTPSTDEPLSKWIEGIQTPSTVIDPRMSPVITVEQCLGNSEKKKDTIEQIDGSEMQNNRDVQPSAFDGKCAIVPSEQQNLPFMKNTVLWKTIESMEVFQRMPQRPHFQPLFHIKESSREGLAVGYMVTFSSIVEKVSRLQFSDPECVTDDILETLAELEKYGFDVRVVQDRVTELLAVKHKQEMLVEEVNGLNSQIVNRKLGRSKIVEEIIEINRQIVNLQEKLSVSVSAQEEEDSEIASLQCKQQKIKESIQIVEREFEDLAFASL